ncbi:class A sortase [Terribacillus sp. DMT04]|uniref:class A sortase n=1 Tax=Terribacillus sp. DMT04 TaxID=2850441 RepID=UPI001C2BE878|nr:class A sortase [Terribacillus sp. DMT04]QXE03542.1 class A sortase [Terribacillus sp. DMT04]
MKKYMKWLAWISIITLFLIGGYNIYLGQRASDEYKELNRDSHDALEQALKEPQAEPVVLLPTENKDNDEDDGNLKSIKVVEDSTSGIVAIPSLKIELAIFEGASDEHLNRGAATVLPGDVMGEGNYTLAAHNMKDKSLFFSRIEQLEDGDEVYTTDSNKIYKFVVTEKRTIHETEVNILNDRGLNEITLLTCESSDDTYRTAVIAELVQTVGYNKDMWEKLNS